MPHFRQLKQDIRAYLAAEEFDASNIKSLPLSFQELPFEKWVSPLFACLLEADPMPLRASQLLGYAVSHIFDNDKEKARIIVRRMIWQMNEESGNIGWGIPYAFAQTLIHSKHLAKEYHKILLSYILDLDVDSNYCDYAPLRIYCFNAAEMLLDAYPEYREYAKRALVQSAEKDEDNICRDKARQLVEKYSLN